MLYNITRGNNFMQKMEESEAQGHMEEMVIKGGEGIFIKKKP